MNTIILIVSFLLTGVLATWAVTKGEREKKARKLSRKILFDLKDKSIDEIESLLKEEQAKEKKDKVKILALEFVIQHRLGNFEPTLKDQIKSVGTFIGGVFAFALLILKWSAFAFLPTLFVGIGLYLLSLIVVVIQFNWIFIAIVFGIFFVVFAIREFDE